MTEKGIRQLDNGFWSFRVTWYEDGRQRNFRRTKGADGKPFKTKKAAIEAKKKAEADIEKKLKSGMPIQRKTFEEVFTEYIENGTHDKAHSTVRKQESLWKNHIGPKFGSRYLEEVTVADIKDYLSELYYVERKAYSYVESFLKLFYLIYGQGYSRNYIDVDTYNKMCVNKNTKIKMPKKKVDDDEEIVIFTPEEVKSLDNYFKDTNVETAYMLGKYLGVRIAEAFGILWEDVDFEAGTITINKQMQYINGVFKLVPVKTRNGNRKIYMCDELSKYLMALKQSDTKEYAESRKQKEKLIPYKDCVISSLELVNTLQNGKIVTAHSMKYHAAQLREVGIKFKYHYLRHTYGTVHADYGTPPHILCNQMGHSSINVTNQYYIGISKNAVEKFKKNSSLIGK